MIWDLGYEVSCFVARGMDIMVRHRPLTVMRKGRSSVKSFFKFEREKYRETDGYMRTRTKNTRNCCC